jgi:hypothetical protein
MERVEFFAQRDSKKHDRHLERLLHVEPPVRRIASPRSIIGVWFTAKESVTSAPFAGAEMITLLIPPADASLAWHRRCH